MEEQITAYLETFAPPIERGVILHAAPVGRAYDPDFGAALLPDAAWDHDELTYVAGPDQMLFVKDASLPH